MVILIICNVILTEQS